MALAGSSASVGARGLRLRLTRKKPLAPPSSSCSGPGGEGQEGRTLNHCSWLDQEGLNESEELWRMLVLRSVNSNLNAANQEMPALPAFFDKNTRNENSQEPAIFTVGTEEFQWIPFPSAFQFIGDQFKNPDSYFTKEKPHQIPCEHEQGEGQQSSGPSPQETSTMGPEKWEPKPSSGVGVKRPLELRDNGVKASKSRFTQLSQLRKKQRLRAEGGAFSPASPQNFVVGSSSPGPPPWKKPGNSLCLEGVGVEKEATATAATSQGMVELDCCPICQIPFTGKLSQLDIDSHLAKCLSESIEDVICVPSPNPKES
ncbi:Fanconi anemia core complex-associated protein 20 isoform X1 [Monodelphis domestica]|uniref:Fanconi anemia core complex-associated protein 20 isoform X1 n=1 Tax=Monodelphis domestica TaxID=13616 RepID=UPI0024E1A485|nr:Fanconi anemia core complex-associated protein 20 isoform X1 [Monodelphis domestica]XP_056651976.1 Fanconi anemia core complex-associated protein 20 isoform X1 [Monodelphis domestica]